MGWGSASRLMDTIIAGIQPRVDDAQKRKEIYKIIIRSFEEGDWDTQDECTGADPAFDEALKELHPKWYEEE